MPLFWIDTANCRKSSAVDAASLSQNRVLDIVDLVARHRLHVARERRLATGKHRRQPELGYVSRHTSAMVYVFRCAIAAGCVAECRICNQEVAGSNLGMV